MYRFPYLKTLVTVFVFITAWISFNSCTKYSFLPIEEKIVGDWTFNDVKTSKSWQWKRENITKEYEGLIFSFKPNGDFNLIDDLNNSILNGNWTLTYISSHNNENLETTAVVYISVNNQGHIDQYIWQVNMLTARKLNVYEEYNNNHYYYKLRRL